MLNNYVQWHSRANAGDKSRTVATESQVSLFVFLKSKQSGMGDGAVVK